MHNRSSGRRRSSSGSRSASHAVSDRSGQHRSTTRSTRSGSTHRHTRYGSNVRHVRVVREKETALPPRGRIDISFFFLVVTLMSIGLVMVFSASYATSLYEEGNSLKIVLKQAFFVALGLAGMLLASYVPYTVYRKLAKPIFLGTMGLMYLALLFPHDTGARRWIRLGSITFQPSELMKFALIVLFASLIAVNYRRMETFRYGFVQFGAWLILALIPTALQRHLSGLLLLLIIGCGMMFIAGTRFRWFMLLVPVVVVGGVGIIVWKGFSYIGTRFETWLNPFDNIQTGSWQICQSLYAIGSGGLTGVGLGNSTQKFLWVSEPQNDFIFAIVCEELGLLGAIAIILLFILFVCSGFSIAMRAPDRFSSMLVTGIILQFGVQALLNIAVVSNAMPTTGISLPFFSAGGTATVVQLCQMGVVLGVSRYCRPTLSKLPDPEKNEEIQLAKSGAVSPKIR